MVYAGDVDIDSVAWYNGNSAHTTHIVGTKADNKGIYDLTGNVEITYL
ncbi:MAG: hypothetical protein II939_07025 [Bacteroidales bacterium]|nr:hypothetical protein [Bacteroidales bacterium]